jgi:hypothetical protein
MKSTARFVLRQWTKPKRRNRASPPKENDLLRESMESVALMDKQDKPRVAETGSDREPKKGTHTVPDLLVLKSVRIRPAPTHYPERSGNVAARSR